MRTEESVVVERKLKFSSRLSKSASPTPFALHPFFQSPRRFLQLEEKIGGMGEGPKVFEEARRRSKFPLSIFVRLIVTSTR